MIFLFHIAFNTGLIELFNIRVWLLGFLLSFRSFRIGSESNGAIKPSENSEILDQEIASMKISGQSSLSKAVRLIFLLLNTLYLQPAQAH